MNNKVYVFCLLVCFLFTLTTNVSAQSQAVKEAQIIYNNGIEETTIDPEQSIKTFTGLIEMCKRIGTEANPTKEAAERWLPRAYYNYGVVQFGNGDLLGATKTFETCLIACEKYGNTVIAEQINSSLYKIYYQLGTIQLEDGRVSAAIASCDKALSLKSDYAKAYYLKAAAYAQKEETTKMLALMNKAITLAKVNGDDMTVRSGNSVIVNHLYRKGSRHNERGEHKEAEKWLLKVFNFEASKTQQTMTNFELGLCYKAMKDEQNACKYFRLAAKGHLNDASTEQLKYLKCN